MLKIANLTAGLMVLEKHYFPSSRPELSGHERNIFEIGPTDTPLSQEEYDSMVTLGWEQDRCNPLTEYEENRLWFIYLW